MSPGARSVLAPDQRRAWRETYATTAFEKLPWFREGPKPALEAAYREGWVGRPGPWLDLGCGAGSDALWLSRRHLRVTGVDVAEGAIRAARRRALELGSSADFLVSDVLELPFENGHFRGASDMGCFHTLPPELRRSYAQEVARVLRPGGRLLLSVAAREAVETGGPPHRLSVEDVARPLEAEFVFRRVLYTERGGRLASYEAWLERRRSAQPPPQ